jgi:type I restriction enzyme M protein
VNAQALVAKVWNFAHVLRDQGGSYQAYISQISYLLFLKMDEERVTQIGEASMLPDGARWGAAQLARLRTMLRIALRTTASIRSAV